MRGSGGAAPGKFVASKSKFVYFSYGCPFAKFIFLKEIGEFALRDQQKSPGAAPPDPRVST